MKKKLLIVALGACLLVPLTAFALFTNGGFQDGDFGSWTIEHGSNSGLTITDGVPTAENVSGGWLPGAWSSSEGLDSNYTPSSDRAFITSGTGNDALATQLTVVKYGLYSARVNSRDGNNHVTRISQEAALAASDRDTDGNFYVRFAWAAVLQDPGHTASAQPYFHITLKNVTQDNLVLYSNFNFVGQAGLTWRTDNVLSGWKWIDWQEENLNVTDNVVVGDILRIELSAGDCAFGGHGGYAYLDGFRTQASPTETTTTSTFSLRNDGLGNGLCGVVFDVDGKGGSGPGPWSGAALLTLYFALFLLPVWNV